ncbi:MAG: fluoride efflux transporter CrcB [Pseudomonadales bacterium]
MTELLAVAAGGALGAVARFLLGEWVTSLTGEHFPWGIFTVNALGSLLIGILFVILVEQNPNAGIWRSLLMVGFLGAFTTFSTFSLQTLALLETGRWLMAASYAFGSLMVCVIAVAVGVGITRAVSGS